MNPLVWCLWADVAAELRSLKRYSVFTFQRMKFMNRTSPHYCRRSVILWAAMPVGNMKVVSIWTVS
ncbi:hypothetical protein C9218_09490 [Escherichia coli]|nr:hypothetical protein C9310_20625 [Escherichia coli]TJE39178.1 hypothetical protein C9218_09490 [Escherichia coli]TJE53707.1 hypothetical protein C9214_09490 [Escherichia coli]TJJ10671.1 hypothetical protein C9120_18725 [Escherichia coli]TJJ31459.1 hypothetical protein C9117_18825 [Escherichia coli]